MINIIKRLERIDDLIRTKATGRPAQLANKLGISERSIYEYLKIMKALGAPIKYDSFKASYYYKEAGSFRVSFLSNGEPLLTDSYVNELQGH